MTTRCSLAPSRPQPRRARGRSRCLDPTVGTTEVATTGTVAVSRLWLRKRIRFSDESGERAIDAAAIETFRIEIGPEPGDLRWCEPRATAERRGKHRAVGIGPATVVGRACEVAVEAGNGRPGFPAPHARCARDAHTPLPSIIVEIHERVVRGAERFSSSAVLVDDGAARAAWRAAAACGQRRSVLKLEGVRAAIGPAEHHLQHTVEVGETKVAGDADHTPNARIDAFNVETEYNRGR